MTNLANLVGKGMAILITFASYFLGKNFLAILWDSSEFKYNFSRNR